MTARRQSRSARRRLVRRFAVAVTTISLVVVAGAARAGLLLAAAVLSLTLVRLPRLEARLFRARSRAVVPVRPEMWARPIAAPTSGAGLGADAHRAYAQALHAVTGAYLAECEREAGR